MPLRIAPQSTDQSRDCSRRKLPISFIHRDKDARPTAAPPWLTIICGLITCLFAAEAQAGTIYGVNHTHWAINHFSVDGHSAVDIIGPYQGGGGGWGYSPPAQWRPGMTVRVDWERGESSTKGFLAADDWQKYKEWEKKMMANNRQLTKDVAVPDYTGQKVCGITVHFLPCDQLQVTTSCYPYGAPEYPIKTPLHLPEPNACPK
ncbi:hypothetical protein PKB_3010 [Pseudomonas knackmussii B13]|uniref:DUF3304 domain-containing protein n=1 Tax=Pseudomonas knackmussii (strain DSM 6978 / CCUG 54928 / LMG 23759 / B13) TaxID=1301098 RepID=A0A024HIM3_PSEKB|nr:DUF3304 domain-containing protein [Pseudomonas knackmussii]CDF84357.1 hypothetical protein PKB_3010 [Pseudomonas knackmussii B13]